MSFLGSLRQKATFIDKIAESFLPSLTRDEKFKLEYRLPDEELIVDDINADLSFVGAHSKLREIQNHRTKEQNVGAYVFSGRLYLTKHFLVFRDAFDKKSCVLLLNLSTIKRVERTPSEANNFSLTLTLYTGSEVLIQLMGLKYKSEQFSAQLKLHLKENIENARKLPQFLNTCYSEFILNKNIMHKTDLIPPKSGLGQQFKYPGNPSMEKEKLKLRLWFDYFKENGENMGIVKNHIFHKLVRVGLPNRIRGEIWELCSGAMYLRYANAGEYQQILEENQGKTSQATDEIEKDLKRSLPEYKAYQTSEGLNRLRNVLTVYSWKNPDVGYCQAMNIVVAGLLIYMTEEQAFWCLYNLCDVYVPGYYSKTMYGTLLDQKVFEYFVEDKIPVLWEHIQKQDIQLSIVSLPWFLSLFFTSMPLEFSFRIMDIFFLNGSRTLFQVSLAILKVNGDALLASEEDGTFIAVLKNYFQTLGDSAYPDSDDPKLRSITKFQQLLVTAFKEFNVITSQIISQQRHKFEKEITLNIETFVKKTQIRQMPKTFYLHSTDLSNIYDIYYQSIETYNISLGKGSSSMNYDVFVQFLGKFCDWCKPCEADNDSRFVEQKNEFLKKLFNYWDTNDSGELTLNNVVAGLDKLKTDDLLIMINNFFNLYDKDGDGELHREEVLALSEGLLFLTEPWRSGRYVDVLTKTAIENEIADRIVEQKAQEEDGDDTIELPNDVEVNEEKYKNEQSERYLKAASNFLQRSIEYARSVDLPSDFNLIELSDDETGGSSESTDAIKKKNLNTLKANAALDPTHPKRLDMATFRMIILADETYELFFSETWRCSTHVNKLIDTDNTRGKALRGMFDGFMADGRKVAKQVRIRVDSVATTRSRGDSILSTDTNATSNTPMAKSLSSSTKEDKFEDIDDFTSEQQEERDDLLGNSWVEMDIDDTMIEPERKQVLSRPPMSNSISKDLIEFEA
ncbi:hypothetical protein TPHA_0D02990 [Tetrapisispora phaffii CBS 4417]|uniref:Rab-GAP TBC domain-containing protein n=1 Tax=Tetrapisispora phaffii (strain ATCC 24235 / CBS 4417 / NBRC 1672 / NRRL Y-8282 / UCD 70-5) TaxID=1071381 RepID=G8BSW4_TETPH|nr:hypothetical protein TPHA_0D02990 [Tetrapisispora phaffii CBS 4417]CCE62935.1 hypothetical protein TPHA_0D02990 [Tetrapisispora phaffii CBS 4417]